MNRLWGTVEVRESTFTPRRIVGWDLGAGLALLSITIAPDAGDVRGYGIPVALVLEEVGEEVDEVEGEGAEEVEDGADEEVLEDAELVVSEAEVEVNDDVVDENEVVDEEIDEEEVEVVELTILVVDVDDVVLSVELESVVLIVDVVVVEISTPVEVAVLMQEYPLDILDGEPEHDVAHAGSLAEVVAVVYVEQKEAAAAEDRTMTRYVYFR
jgi:hypothetical protein